MAKIAMRELLCAAGGMMAPTENRKRWFSRITDRTGLSARVLRAVWQGDQISEETERRLRQAAKSEANELAARLEFLARSMSVSDPEFAGPQVALLERAVRDLRGMGQTDDG